MGQCILSEAPASSVLPNTPLGKSLPSSAFSGQTWMGTGERDEERINLNIFPQIFVHGVLWCMLVAKRKDDAFGSFFPLLERESGWNREVTEFMRSPACMFSNKGKQVFDDLKCISVEMLCLSQKTQAENTSPTPWLCFPSLPGWWAGDTPLERRQEGQSQGQIFPGSGGLGIHTGAVPGRELSLATPGGQKTPGGRFSLGVSFWKLNHNRESASTDGRQALQAFLTTASLAHESITGKWSYLTRLCLFLFCEWYMATPRRLLSGCGLYQVVQALCCLRVILEVLSNWEGTWLNAFFLD